MSSRGLNRIISLFCAGTVLVLSVNLSVLSFAEGGEYEEQITAQSTASSETVAGGQENEENNTTESEKTYSYYYDGSQFVLPVGYDSNVQNVSAITSVSNINIPGISYDDNSTVEKLRTLYDAYDFSQVRFTNISGSSHSLDDLRIKFYYMFVDANGDWQWRDIQGTVISSKDITGDGIIKNIGFQVYIESELLSGTTPGTKIIVNNGEEKVFFSGKETYWVGGSGTEQYYVEAVMGTEGIENTEICSVNSSSIINILENEGAPSGDYTINIYNYSNSSKGALLYTAGYKYIAPYIYRYDGNPITLSASSFSGKIGCSASISGKDASPITGNITFAQFCEMYGSLDFSSVKVNSFSVPGKDNSLLTADDFIVCPYIQCDTLTGTDQYELFWDKKILFLDEYRYKFQSNYTLMNFGIQLRLSDDAVARLGLTDGDVVIANPDAYSEKPVYDYSLVKDHAYCLDYSYVAGRYQTTVNFDEFVGLTVEQLRQQYSGISLSDANSVKLSRKMPDGSDVTLASEFFVFFSNGVREYWFYDWATILDFQKMMIRLTTEFGATTEEISDWKIVGLKMNVMPFKSEELPYDYNPIIVYNDQTGMIYTSDGIYFDWAPVEGADNYFIAIATEGWEEYIDFITTSQNNDFSFAQILFNKNITASGTYMYNVSAILPDDSVRVGEGRFNYNYIPVKNVNLSVTDGTYKITWEDESNYNNYFVFAFGCNSDASITASSYVTVTDNTREIILPEDFRYVPSITFSVGPNGCGYSSGGTFTQTPDSAEGRITLKNDTISWEAVQGAVNYHIVVTNGHDTVEMVCPDNFSSDVKSTLDMYQFPSGTHSLTVYAYYSNYTKKLVGTCQYSYVSSVSSAEKIWIGEDGNIYWNPVTGTDHYILTITDSTGSKTTTDTCLTASSSNYRMLMKAAKFPAGQCSINVTAVKYNSSKVEVGTFSLDYEADNSANGENVFYTINEGENKIITGGVINNPDVIIPDTIDGKKVVGIANYAFVRETGIRYLEIPDGVTKIGWYAFNSCSNITSVRLPATLELIDGGAFERCSALKEISIPKSVTSVKSGAFAQTASLTSIEVEEDNPNYKSVDGVLFSKDGTKLVAYPSGKQGAYTLPETVTSIDNAAFYGSVGLSEITITSALSFIGFEAFAECKGLTSIAINEGVEYIGYSAFRNCVNIKDITLPASLTAIGDKALGYASEQKINGFTIHGYENTIAELYASRHNFAFVKIENETQTIPEVFSEANAKKETLDGSAISQVAIIPPSTLWSKETAGEKIDGEITVTAAPVTADKESLKSQLELNDDSSISLVDLTLKAGDTDISDKFDGLIKVEFAVPDSLKNSENISLHRIYIDESNYKSVTKTELIPCTVSEDKTTLTAYLEHLSVYGISDSAIGTDELCNHSYTNGTCTICNTTCTHKNADNASCPDCGTKTEFSKHSLILADSIGVKFKMTILGNPETAGAYAEVSISGMDGKTVRYDISDMDCSDGKYYSFVYYINSVQMADEITATLHYGDLTVSETYSAKTYIEKALSADSAVVPDDMKELIRNLAEYGHYSQITLSESNGWNIGSDHTEMPKYCTGEPDKNINLSDYAMTVSGEVTGITAITKSLVLDSKTAVVLYIRVDETYAKIPDVSITNIYGDIIDDVEVVKQSDGRYRVKLPGIYAHQLGNNFTVVIDEAITVKVSAMSYAYSALSSQSVSDNLKNAMAALYAYYDSAKSYKQNHS